jgi:hypothetical protein
LQRKNLLGVLLTVVVLAVATYGVVYFALNQNSLNKNDMPSSMVEKSNQFIISEVGQDFFDKHIKIDYSQSKYYVESTDIFQGPYYLMVYSFKMPEKPFVNETIEFTVNTDGNVIPEREVIGIPDPTKCDFSIDEEAAMQIAKNAGVEDGIAAWELSLGRARFENFCLDGSEYSSNTTVWFYSVW